MQPLYVDASDEVTTVIERLKESSEKEIFLVVPKGAVLLQSIVNLKLIKKAARDVDKELTLITTDKIGRNLAAQVGIANLAHLDSATEKNTTSSEPAELVGGVKVHNYFDEEETTTAEPEAVTPIIPLPEPEPTPTEAEVEDQSPIMVRNLQTDPVSTIEIIRPSQRAIPPSTPTPPIPRKSGQAGRLGAYLVFVCILLLIAAGVVSAAYLPKVTITLAVSGQPWSKTYTGSATVGQAIDATHLTTAQLISATDTETLSFNATGTKDIGNQAHGTATLSYVLNSTPQTVPAGTALSANGIGFTTNQAVTVPGATVNQGKIVPGSADVAVTATQSGTDGNLSNVPVTSISGFNMYGSIDQTSGGTTQQVAIVSDTDIANAKQQLQTKIQSTLLSKLASNPANHPPVSDTTKTDRFTLTNYTSTPAVGTQQNTGSVTATGTETRLVYDPAQLLTTVSQLAKEEPESNVTLSLGTITPTVQSVNLAANTVAFSVLATGQLLTNVNTDLIRNQVTGKSFASATSLVQGLVDNSKVTITEQPTWWPLKRIPFSNHFITVQVKP